jgi:hypothetical protein
MASIGSSGSEEDSSSFGSEFREVLEEIKQSERFWVRRALDAEDSVDSAEDSASTSSSSSESESDYSMADTDAEVVVKSAKVPQFDGTIGKFQMSWMRFTACAMLQKFAAALKETAKTHPPTVETEGPNETDDNKKARRRNMAMLYNLTLAFTTESLMSLLFKAHTICLAQWIDAFGCEGTVQEVSTTRHHKSSGAMIPAPCSEHGQEG